MVQKPTPSEAAKAYRALVAAWIEGLEAKFNVSRAGVAARGGVRASTLYRWFDRELNHVPSHSSVMRIATAFGVPPPGQEAPLQPQGFAESGLVMIDAPTGAPAETAANNPNLSWWKVADRALELAGYLPGDRILLDQSATPRPGDVVIAQIYDFERGAAETRLRLYQPPFLVTRTIDPAAAFRPVMLDGERAVVMGPIIQLLRIRDT